MQRDPGRADMPRIGLAILRRMVRRKLSDKVNGAEICRDPRRERAHILKGKMFQAAGTAHTD